MRTLQKKINVPKTKKKHKQQTRHMYANTLQKPTAQCDVAIGQLFETHTE